MKNIAQNNSLTKNTEWLSLDDYVSSDAKSSILYIRIKYNIGRKFKIFSGDLIVVNINQPPQPKDLVLMKDETGFFLSEFSQVKFCKSPLRLVAKNGEPIQATQNQNYEKIGVVTHILKTVGGVQ